MIYFIASSGSPHVKISYTRDIRQIENRLVELQAGNPFTLKIHGVMEGGMSIEKHIHKQFKHLRVKGKWFATDQDDADFNTVMKEVHNIWAWRRQPTTSRGLRNTTIKAS